MKTKTFLLSIILFLVIALPSKAQYWKDVFSPVVVTTIKVYDSIVWVGTMSGAYKFDLNGNYIQRIGGEILSLAKDNSGKMWFGTFWDGVFSYQNNVITKYNTSNGLVSNNICAMACDLQGNMWFGSGEGLVSKYNGTSFTNYTSTNELFLKPISEILVDKNGVVFIGQYYDSHPSPDYYSGISRYDGTWHKDTMERVYSLALDQQDVVWCVGGFKVRKWNGTSWDYVTSTPTIPQNQEIYEVASDSLGNMWFATFQNHYKLNGTSWEVLPLNNGMPMVNCYVIAFDSLNQRWIGGSNLYNEINGGFFRYAGVNLHSFPWMPNRIPELNNRIISDNVGKFWLPTNDLLSYIYPNVDTVISLPYNNRINCLAKDNFGKIWAASYDSVFYQNGNNWSKIPLSQDEQYFIVSNMVFDTANVPIISEYSTIKKHNGQTWDTIGSVLPSDISSMVVDDDDMLWIGTKAHGLYRFDGNNMEQFSGSNLLCDTVKDVLLDNQGAIWVATDKGVAKYFNNAWTSYTTTDGLVNNKVSKIFQDSENQYWFATDDGISLYDGTTWISYHNPDGFIHHSYIKGIAQDAQGNIWFSNVAGMCRLSENIIFIENNLKHDLKIGVYPNPSSDRLFFKNLENTCIVNVYSLNGIKIMSKKINSETDNLDIRSLNSGSYIIEVISLDKKSSLKFIKK